MYIKKKMEGSISTIMGSIQSARVVMTVESMKNA